MSALSTRINNDRNNLNKLGKKERKKNVALVPWNNKFLFFLLFQISKQFIALGRVLYSSRYRDPRFKISPRYETGAGGCGGVSGTVFPRCAVFAPNI